MNFLHKMERKFGKYAIRHLTIYIIITYFNFIFRWKIYTSTSTNAHNYSHNFFYIYSEFYRMWIICIKKRKNFFDSSVLELL